MYKNILKWNKRRILKIEASGFKMSSSSLFHDTLVFVFIKLQQFEYLNGRVLIGITTFIHVFALLHAIFYILYKTLSSDTIGSIAFPMQKVLIRKVALVQLPLYDLK